MTARKGDNNFNSHFRAPGPEMGFGHTVKAYGSGLGSRVIGCTQTEEAPSGKSRANLLGYKGGFGEFGFGGLGV